MNETATHWVFGYASLIWRPGFDFLSRQKALLRGAHRSLCVYSHVHRGSRDSPGLVFGLVRGGACLGMAFEVAEADWVATRDYLRAREQVTMVYREVERVVRLADGRVVRALAYVVDEKHEQFAGRLDLDTQFRLVQRSAGQSGPNPEYVVNTARHLSDLGIRDPYLGELVRRLEGVDPVVPATA